MDIEIAADRHDDLTAASEAMWEGVDLPEPDLYDPNGDEGFQEEYPW